MMQMNETKRNETSRDNIKIPIYVISFILSFSLSLFLLSLKNKLE